MAVLVWNVCLFLVVVAGGAAQAAGYPGPRAMSPEAGLTVGSPQRVQPYTDFSGNISTDTTWTIAMSPVIVRDDVTILAGVTLTIEPGVVVKFNDWWPETRLTIGVPHHLSKRRNPMNRSTLKMKVIVMAIVILMTALGATTFLSATTPLPLLQGAYAAPPPPERTAATAVLPEPLPTATPLPGQGASALSAGWNTLMSEDFEGAFPGPGWQLYSGGDPAYAWGKRSCQAHGGSYSAWGHGGGSSGSQLDCGSDYPPDLENWIIYGPFSLANATAAELTFWYRNNSESDYDLLNWMASTDGQYFYGPAGLSGDSSGWQQETFDLSNVPTLGNLLGQDSVWIAFIFTSDSSLGYEGAYVDDVILRAQTSGGTTATPTVTPTPTPTVTTTPDTSHQHSVVFLTLVRREPGRESVTAPVTSSQGTVITTQSGIKLQVHAGTVPRREDGSDATTTFSIETGVQPPAPLPAGVQQVGSIVKFGPDGFTFAEPVGAILPIPQVADPSKLQLLRYQPSEGKWLRYPMGIGQTSVNVAGYDLGYTAVVSSSQSAELMSLGQAAQDPGLAGAFRWKETNCPTQALLGKKCWYYFTIITSTLKYPGQWEPWLGRLNRLGCTDYPNQPWRCYTMKTGSTADASWPRCYEPIVKDDGWSTEQDNCIFPLPQGHHELCVTAFEAPIELTVPRKLTYSKRAFVDLNATVWWDYYAGGYRNTAPVVFEQGGTWDTADRNPCPKPQATIPVGTGELQATLTWVNTESSRTDLDLHLYGPGGLHIYYSHRGPDHNLQLDRDWQKELGNAIENIFSVGTPLTRGHYTLKVQHYDGDSPKNFTVRFLFRGTSSTVTGSLSSNGEQTVKEFDIN